LQEASLKKDRATTSDEQRERMMIAEQIERAAAEAESSSSSASASANDASPIEEGLKRDEGTERVVLSFSAKPSAQTTSTTNSGSSSSSTPLGGFKNPLKINPLKANPLGRPRVLQSASKSTGGPVDAEKSAGEKKRAAPPMSAAELLIIEDQERKRRRMDRDNLT
jgi:DNA/RNA-binding protein KIN17